MNRSDEIEAWLSAQIHQVLAHLDDGACRRLAAQVLFPEDLNAPSAMPTLATRLFWMGVRGADGEDCVHAARQMLDYALGES